MVAACMCDERSATGFCPEDSGSSGRRSCTTFTEHLKVPAPSGLLVYKLQLLLLVHALDGAISMPGLYCAKGGH